MYLLFASLLCLLVLQYSLDDLLFLNQKCSHNSLLDTVGTSGSTVCSLDGLVGLRNLSVLSWSQGGDTLQSITTVTTLWSGGLFLDVLSNELSTRGLHHLDLVGSGVVRVSSSVGYSLSHVYQNNYRL